ncbi:MAG: hypothetical protein WBN07_07510, partial [Woeseiaceae bacterium]
MRPTRSGTTRHLLLAAFSVLPNGAIGADVETPVETPIVEERIEELVVTSRRRSQPVLLHAGNLAQLDGETIG